MTEVKSGFAFHVHHDELIEFCTDYDERVKYIKENKPLEEQELRLRLFRLIPSDRLPPPLVVAVKAYKKAKKTYEKAKKAYEKAKKTCEPEILKLHKELCPDCPWNGETIFPRANK